jgi:hypothetical protein
MSYLPWPLDDLLSCSDLHACEPRMSAATMRRTSQCYYVPAYTLTAKAVASSTNSDEIALPAVLYVKFSFGSAARWPCRLHEVCFACMHA